MVRRLPWTDSHLKVSYSAVTSNESANSIYNTRSTLRMGYGTPRGRRLMYTGGSGGRSSYSTGKRSSSYSRGGGWTTPSSQTRRLDGLYLEGNWYCNCEPRAQAAYRRVSKKGPNNGKYFYTCETRKCNFFLWGEDAANRAEGVTLTLPPMPDDKEAVAAAEKTPSAPRVAASLPTPTQTTPRQRSMGDYITTQFRENAGTGGSSTVVGQGSTSRQQQQAAETPSRTTSKRKRVIFDFDSDEDDDDKYGLDDLSSDEEKEMNAAMERSAKKLLAAAPSTPSTQRTADDELASTPSTVTRTLFPDAKRRRNDDDTANDTSLASSSTATQSTTTAAPSTSSQPQPPTPSQAEEQLDPTDEVMALLGGGKVDDATARGVRDVLRRFAMKAKGVARGRDSVRTALKGKDERIAELQERVASLEARSQKQRDQIADFKAGMMDLYSKH
ncbi:px domain-containing protein [Colletotrichum musicola]|uniref:Px domain-containing protein n=1 Tax=Colletotrichum musicola TaxID=2175873 RepID=A0A8H6U4Q2_9PEZI|nr:px domain-containing protein [Colletotrichum musicola]